MKKIRDLVWYSAWQAVMESVCYPVNSFSHPTKGYAERLCVKEEVYNNNNVHDNIEEIVEDAVEHVQVNTLVYMMETLG